jgi:hypothetical protein
VWNQIKAWFKRRFGKKKPDTLGEVLTDFADKKIKKAQVVVTNIIQEEIVKPYLEEKGIKDIPKIKWKPKNSVMIEIGKAKDIDDQRIEVLKKIWGVKQPKKRKTRDHYHNPKASQHTKSIGKHMAGKGGRMLKSTRRTMLQHKKISEIEDD